LTNLKSSGINKKAKAKAFENKIRKGGKGMVMRKKEEKKSIWRSELEKDIAIIILGVILIAILAVLPAVPGRVLCMGTVAFFTFVKFALVPESTAKAVLRLGGLKKTPLQWKGYGLDEHGDVVEEKELGWLKRIHFGGLRVVGIRGIDKIYTYNFRWPSSELDKELKKEVVVYHEKELNYVFVRPEAYPQRIEKAETKVPERIPLGVTFQPVIRVVNPGKALFAAPSNWLENVFPLLEPLETSWVTGKELDEILKYLSEKISVLDEVKASDSEKLIDEMIEKKWGIKIEALPIRTVDVPPEFQVAAAAQRKAEFEATAAFTKAEIDAKTRAVETVGTVIEMMSSARGKTADEIKKEIDTDSERQKEFLELAKDLIIRKIGIEGKGYIDIRIPETGSKSEGGEFFEGFFEKATRAIVTAIAAMQRIPMGQQEKERGKEEKQEQPERVKVTKEDIERVKKEYY